MAEKMRGQSVVAALILVVVALWGSISVVGGASLEQQCAGDFNKVVACLSYSTGKAAEPTKECCSSVAEIKKSRPVCLCYFILQTHNGNEQIKNLGIQEARLLQLPSACKLANASISDCPKLLNIPAGSPNYAIFTNSSASATPTTAAAGKSTPAKDDGSGAERGHSLAGPVAIAVALFLYAFSDELAASSFHT